MFGGYHWLGQIYVDVPPEKVWAMLEDPRRWEAILPSGQKFEIHSDRLDVVGASWTTRPEKGGPETEVSTTIVAVEAPRLHVTRSVSGMGDGTMRSRLEPRGRGTTLTVESEFRWRQGKGLWIARLLTPVLTPILGGQSLKKAKRALEFSERDVQTDSR